MNEQKKYLVFTTHSLRDPLTEGLTLHFIKANASMDSTFILITFETNRYRLSKEGEHATKSVLKEQWNIEWHPFTFREGSILKPRKFFSLLGVFFSMSRLALVNSPLHVFAICSPAAAALHLATLWKRPPLTIYAFEPHAQMMLEMDIWKKGSANYVFLSALEKGAAKRASHIMTGTDAMIQKLKSWNVKAKIHKVPTGSDPALFQFSLKHREHFKAKWNTQNKHVIAYVGKLGGLYLAEDLIAFFGAMYSANNNFYFLILTPNEPREVILWCTKHGLPANSYHIGICPIKELSGYLSACDLGVIAYGNIPSRKFFSPTKSGNYLMSGLPILIQRETSEDDVLVTQNNVGVVIDRFDIDQIPALVSSIDKLLLEDRVELAERCMAVGRRERSNTRAIEVWREILARG